MAARALLLIAVLAWPAAADARPRPDLTPSAPRILAPRTPPAITVVDVVRNVGRRRARATRTEFFVRLGSKEVVLGSRRVPALAPGAASRRTVTLRVPARVTAGDWELLACADAWGRVRERRERDNCRTSRLPLHVPAPPAPPPPPPLPPPPAQEPLPQPRVDDPPPQPEPQPEPPPPAPSTDRTQVEDCAPTIPADDAPADAFTQMFAATTSGWTGGDGTLSVRLPGGDTAWVFGDTFLGGLTEDGGRDQPYPDVRNTIVLQSEHEAVQDGDECLTTLFRGTLDEPFSFEMAGEDEQAAWYWLNQPVVHGDALRVFATRMSRSLNVEGSALLTYDLGLDRTTVDEDVPTLPSQWWGAAIADDDPYTYVFGIQDASPRNVFLARTPLQDFDGAWEYRTADGWSDDLADAVPILSDATHLATQISVLRDETSGEWLLVSQDALGPTVNLWRGDEPWTLGAREVLTTLPDVEGEWIYNAVVHPGRESGDGLLLSYNVTAAPDDEGGVMADAALYRPRFVRATLPP